ncbi:MAG: hypothetical protein ABFD50_18435 [Smithella sp.]
MDYKKLKKEKSADIATKAALYNALLFPGWGHFYLKKYKRGILIILPVIAGILHICWSIIQIAQNILKTAAIKNGSVDIISVVNLSINSIMKVDLSFYLILSFIVLLWIFSIIDAYLLGRKQIRESSAKTETE